MTLKSVLSRLGLLFVAWLAACGAAAAQQVTLERDSALHAEPRPDAPVVAQLKQGTSGEAIGKQGAWLNVKTATGTGWLFSFNVRFGTGQAAASGEGAGNALGRIVGGRQKPTVTATIGIRGLEEEDLKRASFDAQQLSALEKYAASKQDGETAARASGLTPARVEYLNP